MSKWFGWWMLLLGLACLTCAILFAGGWVGKTRLGAVSLFPFGVILPLWGLAVLSCGFEGRRCRRGRSEPS